MQLEMLASWVVLGAIVLGAIVLGIFLLFREFWTWYWKQSEQVRLLNQIAGSLERLEARAGLLPNGAPPAAPARDAAGYATPPWKEASAPAGPRPTGFWGLGDA
jgi:hypothetical protein